MLHVLHLDNHLLVVRKSAGVLVQGDHTGDSNLLEQARAYVKEKYNKPGNVFMGLVHRLDRPTSGVVTFARTSTAASRLATQFRQHQVRKIYWALVQGKTPLNGDMTDQMARRQTKSRIIQTGGQLAKLAFKRLDYQQDISWVEIELGTGRHHQIRLQFSHRGHPILGDFKYGSRISFPNRALALHARSLTLTHPTRKISMTFTAEPEPFWPEPFKPNHV